MLSNEIKYYKLIKQSFKHKKKISDTVLQLMFKMNLNRQLVLVSVTSSAATLGLYFLLRKLFATKSSKQTQSKIYEEQALLDQYMLFNFSEPNELLLFDLNDQANINNCFLFPKRVALLCRDYCPDLFFSSDEQVNRL